MSKPKLSIILPAHNEGRYIAACLEALLASETEGFTAEAIIVANACTDDTASVARSFAKQAEARGWGFDVIETDTPGKLNALILGDGAAQGDLRAYLDADVIVSSPVLRQIVGALNCGTARYASGTPVVAPAQSGVTRAFARFWQRMPFVTNGVPGFGLFAVNAAGRARWGRFPQDIISDDTFVRLHFTPDERRRVPATYEWPMVEGLRNLVRVRRRQDEGVAEIAKTYPQLLQNDDTQAFTALDLGRLALKDPSGFAAYAVVKLLVKTPYARSTQRWARGR